MKKIKIDPKKIISQLYSEGCQFYEEIVDYSRESLQKLKIVVECYDKSTSTLNKIGPKEIFPRMISLQKSEGLYLAFAGSSPKIKVSKSVSRLLFELKKYLDGVDYRNIPEVALNVPGKDFAEIEIRDIQSEHRIDITTTFLIDEIPDFPKLFECIHGVTLIEEFSMSIILNLGNNLIKKSDIIPLLLNKIIDSFDNRKLRIIMNRSFFESTNLTLRGDNAKLIHLKDSE